MVSKNKFSENIADYIKDLLLSPLKPNELMSDLYFAGFGDDEIRTTIWQLLTMREIDYGFDGRFCLYEERKVNVRSLSE